MILYWNLNKNGMSLSLCLLEHEIILFPVSLSSFTNIIINTTLTKSWIWQFVKFTFSFIRFYFYFNWDRPYLLIAQGLYSWALVLLFHIYLPSLQSTGVCLCVHVCVCGCACVYCEGTQLDEDLNFCTPGSVPTSSLNLKKKI